MTEPVVDFANSTIFHSAVDLWLYSILAGAICISLFSIRMAWVKSVGLTRSVSIFGSLAGIIFLCWVILGTYYQFQSKNLIVVSGPIKWIIPIDSMTDIVPVRNLKSAPALSVNRLLIKYEGG